MDQPDVPAHVLILTAEVGEGHVAAGRALQAGLTREHGVTARTVDGLGCLGRIVTRIIRDGYRRQLRHAPWSYNAMYRVWRGLAPLRLVGGYVLYRAGRRRMRRLIETAGAEIVVSTHPAFTAVLGRMRRRGEVSVVVCAAVLDLTDNPMWSHRHVDLHLVMHPLAVPWVERVAGADSAIAVRPLVHPRFRDAPDQTAARRRLGLPPDATIVVVSGGGWGVGALTEGVEAALRASATRVVVLAGRNAEVEASLRRAYAERPEVRVLGFTDEMPQLLRAADALVHGTGGLTSMEAIACGCPVVGFGTRLAHVREHYAALSSLGMCRVAADGRALHDELAQLLAAPRARPRPTWPVHVDGPAAVLAARRRIRPLARWRVRTVRASLSMAVTATLAWAVATEQAFSLAASPLRLTPAAGLPVRGRDVGVVLLTTPDRVAVIAARLRSGGIRVSFALQGDVSGSTVAALRRSGDDAVPILARPSTVRWLGTADELDDVTGFADDRLALVPGGQLSLGEYLLARSTGHRLLTARWANAHRPVRPGGVVLVAADGVRPVHRVVDRLKRAGLTAVPVSRLLARTSTVSASTAPVSTVPDSTAPTSTAPSSTAPATAGESASRTIEPAATSPSPTAPAARPLAPCPSAAAPTSGPTTTGTMTCSENSTGATRATEARCSAVISASSPSRPATAHPPVHSRATTGCPAWTASATSWVTSPLQAKHRPATTAALRPPARRRRASDHAMTVSSAAAPRTTGSIAAGAIDQRGAGATRASPVTPAAIAPTAARSRRRTGAPSRWAPAASSPTSPTARVGWTTDRGASRSAAAWTGQPSSPSTVPSTQRRRRTNPVTSPRRHESSAGAARASSDWSITPAL